MAASSVAYARFNGSRGVLAPHVSEPAPHGGALDALLVCRRLNGRPRPRAGREFTGDALPPSRHSEPKRIVSWVPVLATLSLIHI